MYIIPNRSVSADLLEADDISHNIFLSVPFHSVLNRFVATASVYGINYVDVSLSVNAIKNSIWSTFAGHTLQSL